MRSRAAIRAAAVLVLALVPASASAGAGDGAARPPVALTASPSRVEIAGNGQVAVRITNAGASRVALDVTRAGFALDLRGRPRIVARQGATRSAVGWLALRPRKLVLPPGTSGSVTVASKLPVAAEPGDHDALVLLTTRRRAHDGLAVRMRMGVLVVVRAPGTVVHRLQLSGLHVVRSRRSSVLELVVKNRGNITESFSRSRAVVSLLRGGRRFAKLMADSRELRPGTRGVLQFRYRAHLAGPAVARVDVTSESGRVLRRTFRVRL